MDKTAEQGQPTPPPAGTFTITPTLAASGGIAAGRHRIHPAYIVMTALRVILALVITISATLLPILSQEFDDSDLVWILVPTLIVCLAVIAMVVGYSVFYYRRFSWEITESEIHIYSGIVFRKQVHIPFLRIQSIDFKASVPERVLGIVTLRIETAGGAVNRSVAIPALKLNHAEALRAEAFSRKQDVSQAADTDLAASDAGATNPGSVLSTVNTADELVADIGELSSNMRGIFAQRYDEASRVEFEYRMKASELVLAAVSSDMNLTWILVAVMVASQLIGQLVPVLVSEDEVGVLMAGLVSLTLPTLVLLAVGFFVMLFGAAVLGTAVTYGGFTARRRGGRIEVEHGLLQRTYHGVGVPRVQTVVVKQGFIRRVFGYAELSLQTVDSKQASDNQETVKSAITKGLMLHPFIRLDRVDALLHGLLPEFDGRPQADEQQSLPKVALRRAIMRRAVFPSLLIMSLIGLMWILYAAVDGSLGQPADDLTIQILLWGAVSLTVVWMIVSIGKLFGAILWFRHARYAWNRHYLTLRQGAWSITSTYIPRRKIQWGEYKQNPFQRWSNVATLQSTTAAGSTSTSTSLRDLPLDKAQEYLDWLRPRSSD